MPRATLAMPASLAARAVPMRAHIAPSRREGGSSRITNRRGGRIARYAGVDPASPIFVLGLLDLGSDGDTLLPDGDVAMLTAGALAALTLASLGVDDPSAELRARVNAVEPLEVRLDVTTLWCFVLARELLYVPPGGKVVDLGFSVEDILRLGCVVGTGSCLGVAWLGVGTLTGQFRRAGFLGDDRTLIEYLKPGWTTGAVAGALWQLSEAYLCRGLDGVAGRGNVSGDLLTTVANLGSGELATAAAALDWPNSIASVLALIAAMQTYRVFSYFVP